ncbi:MAG TPA: glutaredoxin family protein [Candidatus Aminicenantes bacterium]|nr:glutaredoxin family protein [Candidatus Aminicenantes bacterium]
MNFIHQEGIDRGKVLLFTLSTCIWCRKTKRLLEELKVAYDYIDMDLLEENEQQEADRVLERWNPRLSYPTLVINDEEVILGFKEDQIRTRLG